MKRNYKLVEKDPHNKDEYLIKMFETRLEAENEAIRMRMKSKLGYSDKFVVKPVDIEKIENPVATDFSHYCYSLIPNDEWEHVMKGCASAEICPNNLMCGYGGQTYYFLSKMIPKYWNVIDIGASYGAQSYFFQHHQRYIAIEPFKDIEDMPPMYNFQANGTERIECTCGEFIEHYLPKLDLDLKETFAIVNYVPEWFGENPSMLAKKTFPNIWCFYPYVKVPQCA